MTSAGPGITHHTGEDMSSGIHSVCLRSIDPDDQEDHDDPRPTANGVGISVHGLGHTTPDIPSADRASSISGRNPPASARIVLYAVMGLKPPWQC